MSKELFCQTRRNREGFVEFMERKAKFEYEEHTRNNNRTQQPSK